jgi:hypothetical protein
MNAQSIITQLQTEKGSIDVLGFVAWWNVHNVEVTQPWFRDKLKEAGLDGDKYSREHNYRSTVIRCLRSLEENRIIRKVTEDDSRLVYQFTAEQLIDSDPDNLRLEYKLETTVEIDKDIFLDDMDFNAALTKCDPKVREILVPLFAKEKITFRSSDITRYIQKIFNSQADLIALRPQGAVYFIPSTYKSLIEQVAKVMDLIHAGGTDSAGNHCGGTARLERFPVPDVSSARQMVGDAAESELLEVFTKMESEIKALDSGKQELTDKWIEHRENILSRMKTRIDRYAEVLGDKTKELHGQVSALSKLLKPRKLEV